jgi:hypothetical protein
MAPVVISIRATVDWGGVRITNANSVLVAQVNTLLGIDDVALSGAVDVSLLDIEVAACLFPANLYGRVHDHVGFVKRLAFCLALVLPQLLHGKHAQHDGFGRANRRGTNGIVILAGGGVEETGDHGDTSVLDVGADRVLFVVDKVLGEGVTVGSP